MVFKNTPLRLVIVVTCVLMLALAGLIQPGTSASLPPLQTTPDPCGPAVALAQNPLVNVRSGPSISYPVIGQTGANALPILGRHHAFTWWQISLADGTIGWVSDDFVAVSGYIAGVQLVEAPENNGFVPDLNEEWVPFIPIPCLVTPPPTAVAPVLLPTRNATVEATGAPESGNDVWSQPLNLSRSGVASAPAVVVESAGVSHVIWQEAAASNFLYVRGQEGNWSAAVGVELPFGTRRHFPDLREEEATPLFRPQLLVDATDRIHALWVDADGVLFYSVVAANEFARYDAWSPRQPLGEAVVAFDAALDGSARLHVSYLSTQDLAAAPAGVYYQRLDNGQAGLPVLLYSSGYFRAVTADRANLEIAVAGGESGEQVYVSWDNRPLDTLFVISSADGGQQWGDVIVVDRLGPEDSPEAMTPSNIRVATSSGGALLLWQADHEGTGCRQYYRWLGNGQSWQEPQLLETLEGCYRDGQLFSGENGSILLLAYAEDGTYLLAWDGERWSEPQLQAALTAFVNAETLRTVQFDCYRGQFHNGQLLVAGCSSGEVNDIWITSRVVESTASWFSPQLWSQPAPIDGANFEAAAIELVATNDGLIHAFFSQRQDPGIYYTRWDGATWSRTTLLFKVPDGEAAWPVVVAGPGDELFLLARSSSGSLYFSLANSSDAVAASGWSTPAHLQIAHDGKVSGADVSWDANGAVSIAYSVPVNNERGVYLVQSTDQGETWSQSLQLFDGAAAGFDLVGMPSLLIAADGGMHILWKRQSLRAEDVLQTVSLYYARSEDAGRTFSEAEPVVETPVVWQAIAADGMGNLHRLWQQSDMLTTIWDQSSFDQGRSWAVAQGLPAEWRNAAVSADPAGRLHLIGLGLDSLGHWLWDGRHWQAETSVRRPLAAQGEEQGELLAAAINQEGEMVVVLASAMGTDEATDGLLYMTRPLDLPPPPDPVEVTPTPLIPPTNTPAAPTPEPSATAAVFEPSADGEPAGPQRPTDGIMANAQLVVAFLPVGLLLLVVLGRMVVRTVRVKGR